MTKLTPLLLVVLILSSLPLQAQTEISDTLKSTILEVQNQVGNQAAVTGSSLSGLDAWIDNSEISWGASDIGGDFNDQKLSFDVNLKSADQIGVEQDILNMGQAKSTIKLLTLLEKRLKHRYLALIDFIAQKKRRSLLSQQHRQLSSELNNWKTKVNSGSFRADRLQQADVSLDKLWGESLDNHQALKHYQAGFKQSANFSTPSIAQMLSTVKNIIETAAYKQHNTEILKAEFETKLARKEQQRRLAQEKLALNSVKLQYDNKDRGFGVSVGVKMPITKNSYESLLKKQELHYSALDAHNVQFSVADELAEKQMLLYRLQDQWLSYQKVLGRIKTRITRISKTGNLDLLINLKADYLDYQGKQNQLNTRALRLYIALLSRAGMLSSKPYRNWLKSGTPRLF